MGESERGVGGGGGRGVGGGWQEGSQKRGVGWWCVGSKLDGGVVSI